MTSRREGAVQLAQLLAHGVGLGAGPRLAGRAPSPVEDIPRQAHADVPGVLPVRGGRHDVAVGVRVRVAAAERELRQTRAALRSGDGVGGSHARGERLALGPLGLRLGHQALELRPERRWCRERLRRLDARGGRQREQALEIRLGDVGRGLRPQALELGAVALDLDGQHLVARRHPEALAVPGVLQVGVVGAERLSQDALALAPGHERPVGALRLEHEVGAAGAEVLARGRAALVRGRDLLPDAAARVERQRERGAQPPVVLDVREHHDPLDRLRRVVGRSEDGELGHLGAPGVAGAEVQLRPALRAGSARLRFGGCRVGRKPGEARRGRERARDGVVHVEADDAGLCRHGGGGAWARAVAADSSRSTTVVGLMRSPRQRLSPRGRGCGR